MSADALAQIAKDVAAIKAALLAGAVAFATALGGSVPAAGDGGTKRGQVASDSLLDSEYGDPEIKKDPPRWEGESFAGRRYSETTPEFLDQMAGFNDWRADQDDLTGAKDKRGRPKSGWARKDAALARGWAARLRKGWKPKTAAAPGATAASDEDYGDGGDDDIPF